LSAPRAELDEAAPADAPAPASPAPASPAPGAEQDTRYRRLADGVRSLRAGGGPLNLSEHTLMVIGGIVAPLGLVVILIGWYGAAHSPFLFQQVPYLISGLGLGLGLVFLGSFFYFAHWVTQLVKEGRAQSAAMIEAITRLEETIKQQAEAAAPAGDPLPSKNGHATLVATYKGTMAHRTDCAVVVGKPGLRRVSVDDRLDSCRLCDPYADAPVS
jgi:hypothetical protein